MTERPAEQPSVNPSQTRADMLDETVTQARAGVDTDLDELEERTSGTPPESADADEEPEDEEAAAMGQAEEEAERAIDDAADAAPSDVAATVAAGTAVAGAGAEMIRQGGILGPVYEIIERIKQTYRGLVAQLERLYERVVESIFGREVPITDSSQMSMPPVDVDPDLTETSHDLTPEETVQLTPIEVGYAETIAEYTGLTPERVESLSSHDSLKNLSRTELYKYVSEMAEACDAYDIPADIGIPLMLATGITESTMNPLDSQNDDSTVHKGLYQFSTEYWEGDYEEIQGMLLARGVQAPYQSVNIPATIYDSRVQTFALANRFSNTMERLGGRWETYDQNKVARDMYVVHNLGPGHTWFIRYLDGEFTNEQLLRMYERRVDGKAILPTSEYERVTFSAFALRKGLILTDEEYARRRDLAERQGRESFETYGRSAREQTWNKTQGLYHDLRQLLFGRDVVASDSRAAA